MSPTCATHAACATSQLSLSGATLTNEGGDALSLDWASIGGSAFLDEGFTAVGAVRGFDFERGVLVM